MQCTRYAKWHVVLLNIRNMFAIQFIWLWRSRSNHLYHFINELPNLQEWQKMNRIGKMVFRTKGKKPLYRWVSAEHVKYQLNLSNEMKPTYRFVYLFIKVYQMPIKWYIWSNFLHMIACSWTSHTEWMCFSSSGNEQTLNSVHKPFGWVQLKKEEKKFKLANEWLKNTIMTILNQ